jgi:iron complex outermembrane recepter protein
MKSFTMRSLAFAATAMTSLHAGAAHAQAEAPAQEEPEAVRGGGDIVVTARRVEERLQDVPISITVYNQEQLANRNIINSTDLATYTPSLAANSRFGTEKASFAIRSFTQDLNTAPTVGVYFADVVAPRLASNITSGGGAGVGMMFDLQNVQVLKGPQGTLFGRNTTGGAILLLPNRPTSDLEGYVEGTIGNHEARRVQAVLNVPLADTFKIRLGVDRYKREGYINNISGIGPDKFNDVNYWSFRLSILAELTPDLENYTIATYSRTNTNGMLGRIVACNRGTVFGSTGFFSPTRALACQQLDRSLARGDGFYDAENSMPNPFVKQEQWQIINTTTWHASDTLTVKNIASYAEARERYAFNISGDNFPGVWVTTTFPGNFVPQDKRANYTEELQLQGRTSDDSLTWQLGGYLERSIPQGGQFSSQQQYTAVYAQCSDIYTFVCNTAIATPATSILINNNVYTYKTYGIYGQATYKLSDQFAVTAGIRNTWEYAHVDANNVRVVPGPTGIVTATCSRVVTPLRGAQLINNPVCTRSFTAKSNRPTWLINLDYKPNEDVLIYAKWARGYRGGGVNEANVGIETWAPEKLDTYEVGLKTSFRGSVSGNLNLAAFWNEFRDQQTSVFIPACTNATTCAPVGINGIQNVGQSRVRGFEADGSLTFNNFRFDFGYAYLDAKVTGGSVPFCESTRFICNQAVFLKAGTRLLLAPKHRFTVTGTYTLPLDESLGDVSIGATFTHTSKQFQTHTLDLPFAVGVIPENYGLLPATDLLNLNLNWKGVAGSPIDLALFATNVTNEKYRVATGGGLPSTGAEFILLGEPRMYGLRVRYRFGD